MLEPRLKPAKIIHNNLIKISFNRHNFIPAWFVASHGDSLALDTSSVIADFPALD
jgi:hypothetical protein